MIAITNIVLLALVVALVVGFYGCLVYAGWNLALAPWLGWREMPVSVALAAGVLGALLSVRVKR